MHVSTPLQWRRINGFQFSSAPYLKRTFRLETWKILLQPSWPEKILTKIIEDCTSFYIQIQIVRNHRANFSHSKCFTGFIIFFSFGIYSHIFDILQVLFRYFQRVGGTKASTFPWQGQNTIKGNKLTTRDDGCTHRGVSSLLCSLHSYPIDQCNSGLHTNNWECTSHCTRNPCTTHMASHSRCRFPPLPCL